MRRVLLLLLIGFVLAMIADRLLPTEAPESGRPRVNDSESPLETDGRSLAPLLVQQAGPRPGGEITQGSLTPFDPDADFSARLSPISVGVEVARPAVNREAEVRPLDGEPFSFNALYNLALSVSGDSRWAVWAAAVANCESTGNPRAPGDAGERGLWQIHPVHRGFVLALGYSWDDLWEPEVNARVAYALWQRDGVTPWISSRGCWG